ncbi:MAG: tRNA pseudouridine(55) synthase TruB [Bdellovibrionales bacterium]|nr:tRNA pseudouridine(55) synthase TruB [Bdellovibrionales bacterium]
MTFTSGCLLVAKPEGISSFGVIEALQRALLNASTAAGPPLKKRDLPKFGHGGTLDPFATGLLLVCVGDGTKLSRYFLGSRKEYRARIRFGATTIPGDPTEPLSQTCDALPLSLSEIRQEATRFTESAYLQTPPMHSAKKIGGKVLYELAREGIEIERKPSEVRIHEFEVLDYSPPLANIRVSCSAGTYIRVLGQDLGKRLGSLAYLETLERTGSGKYRLEKAQALREICEALEAGTSISALHCFVPFEKMLDEFPSIQVSEAEALQIRQGQTRAIHSFEQSEIQDRLAAKGQPLKAEGAVTIRLNQELVAIFSGQTHFTLERVFQSKKLTDPESNAKA